MSEQVHDEQCPTWDGSTAGIESPVSSDETLIPVVRDPSTQPAFAPPAFDVLEEVGKGGTSRVYRARQLGTNREVALKVLRAGVHASVTELARFQTEARAVARVVHPGVVQIHDVGVHDSRPFLCLEWMAGGSLADRLAHGPMPPAEAARIAAQLARAIQHAHDCGVVHRDLSPANVLLTSEGTPKVGDFGVARLLGDGQGMTQTRTVLGTPNYLAPEQAGGKSREAGPAADVYG